MQIIRCNAIYEETINKSKFIAYSYYIEDEGEASEIIKELWKEHRKATHICTAFRFGLSEVQGIYNDDGEPALTAGRPILNELEWAEITNTLICVVRYFGGIKLGKGGLIRAYSSLAKGVINSSEFKEVISVEKVKLSTDYSSYSKLLYYIEKHKLLQGEQEFKEDITLNIYLKQDEKDAFYKYVESELYGLCYILDKRGKIILLDKTIEELEE